MLKEINLQQRQAQRCWYQNENFYKQDDQRIDERHLIGFDCVESEFKHPQGSMKEPPNHIKS